MEPEEETHAAYAEIVHTSFYTEYSTYFYFLFCALFIIAIVLYRYFKLNSRKKYSDNDLQSSDDTVINNSRTRSNDDLESGGNHSSSEKLTSMSLNQPIASLLSKSRDDKAKPTPSKSNYKSTYNNNSDDIFAVSFSYHHYTVDNY